MCENLLYTLGTAAVLAVVFMMGWSNGQNRAAQNLEAEADRVRELNETWTQSSR